MPNRDLKQLVHELPELPGVYLMKDTGDKIIYIGKAASLRHRVNSYFQSSHRLDAKTQLMAEEINDIEFFVTSSEQEALILELNLIKRHRPHYNIMLKDDKGFPYLKITNEAWPRLEMTRRYEPQTGRYFGPFASSYSVKQVLELIKQVFPFRSCERDLSKVKRPCLEYDIKRCPGPCTGRINPKDYDSTIRQIALFLEGRQEKVITELKHQMISASEKLDFERAALMRDQVSAIGRVIEAQKIAVKLRGEADVIALAKDKNQSMAQVFFIRGNKLIGKENFILKGTASEPESGITDSFVTQFYSRAPHIPPLILLQHPLSDETVIASWLSSRRGSQVAIEVPKRGHKKDLVNDVAENAERSLAHYKIKHISAETVVGAALEELKSVLSLPSLPKRIEGYDISNIQGTSAVGSMVVFTDGKPDKRHYRRFRIKTVEGANDFAMMAEVIRRRFNRASSDAAGGWEALPDLILIDGGKGQLGAAIAAMEQKSVVIPIMGLAKEHEEVFLPERDEPICLLERSLARQLLQRIRDEAHRFALGYFQKVHKRESFDSALDNIPGIGIARKRALLKAFGSVSRIRSAESNELSRVKGMNLTLARLVKESL